MKPKASLNAYAAAIAHEIRSHDWSIIRVIDLYLLLSDGAAGISILPSLSALMQSSASHK